MASGRRWWVWAIAAGGLGLGLLWPRARYDLRGKTVLITGGSRGLGLVLARTLARHGARLAICARDEAELRRARDELARDGAEVVALPCDVRRREEVDRMVAQVRERLGPIDVVINNAGVITVGPVWHMTLADFEEAMATNFWATLYTTLAVAPEMRGRGRGRIVNITSIGGKISVPHLVPYSASKFAAVGLSQGLRAELLQDGIVVTTVVPGLMRTGSPRNAFFKGQHQAEYAWFSISDSLPLSAISAESAARRIVAALRAGSAEVVLSLPARLAMLFHGLCPGLTADLLGLVNRLLPGPGGIGEARATGAQSQSPAAPSWLTTLGDKAAVRNNEIG